MLGENSQSGVDFSRRIGLVQVFRCEGFFKVEVDEEEEEKKKVFCCVLFGSLLS